MMSRPPEEDAEYEESLPEELPAIENREADEKLGLRHGCVHCQQRETIRRRRRRLRANAGSGE